MVLELLKVRISKMTFAFRNLFLSLTFNMKNMRDLHYQRHLSNVFPGWLLTAFRLVGFLPLKVTHVGLKFVPWSAAISVTLLSVSTTILCFLLYKYPSFQSYKTMKEMAKLIKFINVFIGGILIIISNILMSKKGRFDSLLTHISEVEYVFVMKGLTSNITRLHDSLKFLHLIVFIFILIPLSVTVNPNKVQNSMMYVFHLYIILMEILFIKLAELLSRNFVRLNKMIRWGYIQEHKEKKMKLFVISSDPPKITIEEIRAVHYKLCKAIEEINMVFGLQMACVFFYIFVLAIINPYYIVEGFVIPQLKIFDTLYIIKQMAWSLFAFTQLFAITWISSYTTYHAKRTGFYVSCLLSSDLCPEIRSKVKLALMQISSNTYEFGVLDLFKINTTNITSFAGMAVTYFIVILQFESSNKHKNF